LIAFQVFVFILVVIFANLEIQIEGKDGWAKNLPCWRIEKGWLLKLSGGRPLTGYHFYLWVFLSTIAHLPVFFVPWSLRLESLILGFLAELLLLEDLFWFIFNPHYGIKNFRKGRIPWHKRWWGPLPDFFWYLAAVSILLLYLGAPILQ